MGRSHPDTPCRTVRATGETAHHHGSLGITGHIRTYPDISGHIRTCHDRRVRKEPVPDRVPYGQSRAKRAGTGSRTLWSVACERSRCRIASRMARRVPYRPSPDRVPDGSSPDRVSSCPCPCRRPRYPCRAAGLASRSLVVCHAPAQQRL